MDDIVTSHALALPRAFMTEQWMGSHVFKVGDAKAFKMFAVLQPGRDRLTLKTPDPDIAEMLIEAGVGESNVHLPRGGWVALRLDRMDPDDVCERVSESYGVVVATLTKSARARLGLETGHG